MVGRDMADGRGDTVGHAPNWCTACLLGLWMAMSPFANALDVVNRSPPNADG